MTKIDKDQSGANKLELQSQSSEEQLSTRDLLYIATDPQETTFQNDDKLPSLPVPDLRDSLDKYLDTVRPHVTEEEFNATETIVRRFEQGDGKRLQQKLVERARQKRNWLEEWWQDVAYLTQRAPLIPNCSMSAPMPIYDFFPPLHGSRVERLALVTHFQMQFWSLLRREKMRPMVHKGVPWSMDQFKRLFNTVRIPREGKDQLICPFRTVSEGPPAPTNAIVLHKGYIFSFNLVCLPDEDPYTPEELAYQLYYIEKWCTAQEREGPGVGALTAGERDQWAVNREYLINLHPDNEKSLNIIESAALCIVLDDSEPLNQQEILVETMTGDCTNRWADKSLTSLAFLNGTCGAVADHTPFDGIATAILTHFVITSLTECKGKYKGVTRFRDMPKPELIEFHLDEKVYSEILSAKEEFRKNSDNIALLHASFDEYGKSILRPHRIHPEAYIQLALQLAYYRMHARPGSCYCTASTRQFFRGRTETCRSCFPEAVEFAKAVVQGNSTPGELYSLLHKAVKKFLHVMNDAMNNNGVDRHFLGLYMISTEEGIELPEMFSDPVYYKSGGAGNYILSTSCTGYWNVCGGVPPMRNDGYGTFYGIEDDRLTFVVTAFKNCPETNPEAFYNNIRITLRDMQNILNASKL